MNPLLAIKRKNRLSLLQNSNVARVCIGVSLVAAVLISTLNVFAQSEMEWKGSGGWGVDTPYNRLYNSGTMDTIVGEVISVEQFMPEKKMAYGVHLKVATSKEAISVHLGPAWFIENQDINIKTRDKIEVVGSRMTYKGKPTMMAAEVKTGQGTLRLRNETGAPVWIGWVKHSDPEAHSY